MVPIGTIVITGYFPVYDVNMIDTGYSEFGVSHGVDLKTGKTVTLPCVEYPSELGAVEKVFYNYTEKKFPCV